ncbi:unnamed protein product [Amoebophrya sp. A25]|nr:unnamed protein product [Amoebophrya sp. A25]|eukprot:GSA25T00026719001.1
MGSCMIRLSRVQVGSAQKALAAGVFLHSRYRPLLGTVRGVSARGREPGLSGSVGEGYEERGSGASDYEDENIGETTSRGNEQASSSGQNDLAGQLGVETETEDNYTSTGGGNNKNEIYSTQKCDEPRTRSAARSSTQQIAGREDQDAHTSEQTCDTRPLREGGKPVGDHLHLEADTRSINPSMKKRPRGLQLEEQQESVVEENETSRTKSPRKMSTSPFSRLVDAYDFVRKHYTDSPQVVPRFQDSESNLSQASLNRQMLEMLELAPGQTIADLGSGCGITANAFAAFGCVVDGFEFHKKSTEISNQFAHKLLGETLKLVRNEQELQERVRFFPGAVNDNLPRDKQYDRLHGGYMMNAANAEAYARENLKPGGIAVLNVGGDAYLGDVYIFRKDATTGKVTHTATDIGVIFQPDAKPGREQQNDTRGLVGC